MDVLYSIRSPDPAAKAVVIRLGNVCSGLGEQRMTTRRDMLAKDKDVEECLKLRLEQRMPRPI